MYVLTVRYTSGYSDIGTCDTFTEVRGAIEFAQQQLDYVGHSVREV